MAATTVPQFEQLFKDLQKIPGWFWPIDMFLFLGINQLQQTGKCTGDILEIGAYKGKSAILLGHCLDAHEELVVCDTFESDAIQEQNLAENQTYYANLQRQTFEHNFHRFHSHPPQIYECSSTALSDHVGLAKRFRLIHIDGSHLFEIVQQDIKLSKDILRDNGIVIFDDYRSPHTPGVAAALWDAVLHQGLHPLCLSPWKMYAYWGGSPPFDAKALMDWLRTHEAFQIEESIVGNNRMLIVDLPSSVSAKYEQNWRQRTLWSLRSLVKP
jgi:hypothetical protein